MGAALGGGLLGSAHCVGMCGPFAAACAGSRRLSGWHLGRLATYVLLGGLAGGVGEWMVPWGPWGAGVSLILLVLFSLALAGVLPEPRVRMPGLTRALTWSARHPRALGGVLFGAANGFLPCGLVYATLGLAVAAGHPGRGAAVMLAFWIGTVPLLTVVSTRLRSWTADSPTRRRWAAGLILVAGLVALGMRGGWMPH